MAVAAPNGHQTHATDQLLGFSLPERNIRGRILMIDQVLDQILTTHAYPDAISNLLSEALVLTGLLGSLLRPDEGQLTLQARGEGGPVELLVADYRDGQLRGYASQNLDRRFESGDTLDAILGQGYLAITLDQTVSAERYQGIVALEGTTLQQTAEDYFTNSEQIPTIVRLAVSKRADGRHVAGGIIVQHLARAEEGAERLHLEREEQASRFADDWEHVEALVSTLSAAELTDAQIPHEELLWRLFHEEEVRIFGQQHLSQGCRCSPEHIESVIAQFPAEEQAEMRGDDGKIVVDCEFCAKKFVLDL